MSIVVLVQVGRSAVREFHKMIGLPTMMGALAGNTRHRTAVVEFDSRPRTLLDFSSNPDAVERAVYSIQPGDGGAAILDAVWYAVDMLQDEPQQNQRVIVLLSETRDHGSRTPLKEVVRKIGRSDVVVYSLAFSPGAIGSVGFLPSQRRQRRSARAVAHDHRRASEKYCRGHSADDRRPISPLQSRKTAGQRNGNAGEPGT